MHRSFSSLLSWIISIVFHPIAYVSLAALLLLNILPEFIYLHDEVKNMYLYRVFLLTYVFPIAAIPLYLLLSRLFRLNPDPYHTRIFLLILTTFMYVFAYNVLKQYMVFTYINVFLLLSAILLFISLIITYFWRISLHMIGAGAFFGLFLTLLFFRDMYLFSHIIASALICGFVGFARLYLKAHNQSQIYVGFSVGLSVSVLFYFFLFL
jgi:hypothetical protein